MTLHKPVIYGPAREAAQALISRRVHRLIGDQFPAVKHHGQAGMPPQGLATQGRVREVAAHLKHGLPHLLRDDGLVEGLAPFQVFEFKHVAVPDIGILGKERL